MTKQMKLIVVLTIAFLHCLQAKPHKYKPVYLIHGILTGSESMLLIEEEILRVRKTRNIILLEGLEVEYFYSIIQVQLSITQIVLVDGHH